MELNKTMKKEVTDADIDEIYNAMDALMKANCFSFINNYLGELVKSTWKMPLDILLAYATVTLPYKSLLPTRKKFIENCMRLHSDSKLWKGLE